MPKNEPKQLEQPAQEVTPAPAQEALPLTVAELALKHGQTFHKRAKDGSLVPTVPEHDSVFKRDHLAAEALHGWAKHERHTSEAVRLSDDDYLAALEATKAGKTHAPANKRAADETAKKQASRDAAKKGA